MCVVILVPLALVPIPPLLDYPNHLARLWLIAGGANILPLDSFYQVNWHGIATNIGIDLGTLALGHWINPFLLGRIFLALAALLPPLGCAVLYRAETKSWTPWAGVGFILWPSITFLAGFLNLQIGFGLAMLFTSADPFLNKKPSLLKTWVRLLSGCILMIIHPFALMFYALLLAGMHFGSKPITRKDLLPRTGHAFAASWITLVPVALLFLHTQNLPGNDSGQIRFLSLGRRIQDLMSPFFSYNYLADTAFIALLAAITIHLILHHACRFHVGFLLCAGLTAVLALCMPSVAFGTGWLDRRLPLMLYFILICATRIKDTESSPAAAKRKIIITQIIITFLILIRTFWIGGNWLLNTPCLDAFARAAEVIPAGSRVLPVQPDYIRPRRPALILFNTSPTYRHYAALLIPWRHAFEPFLFAQPGKQPITIRENVRNISTPGGGILISAHYLIQPGDAAGEMPYLANWQQKFDYIIVFNADTPHIFGKNRDTLPELKLIRNTGFVRVYKIRRT